MKYNHVFKGLPEDVRPMGTNNLNQLVHHHLGSQSFDMVACVANNLMWLKHIHNNLTSLMAIHPHLQCLDKLMRNEQTVLALAESMPALKDIYHALDELKVAAPQLKTLATTMNEANIRLAGIETLIKNTVSRYQYYEDVENMNAALIQEVQAHKEALTEVNKQLLHLQAVNAVNDAIQSKINVDIVHAKAVIALSEQVGNDEKALKAKLG